MGCNCDNLLMLECAVSIKRYYGGDVMLCRRCGAIFKRDEPHIDPWEKERVEREGRVALMAEQLASGFKTLGNSASEASKAMLRLAPALYAIQEASQELVSVDAPAPMVAERKRIQSKSTKVTRKIIL